MKEILFVGPLSRGQVSKRRADLFQEAGWQVRRFDTDTPLNSANVFARQLATRLQMGPVIDVINRNLFALAETLTPGSAIFFDKPVFVRPETVKRIKSMGLRTVCYTPDDPFGPRHDGVWRLFLRAIPFFDIHIVPRQVTVDDFHGVGAKCVLLKRFSFDPRLQHPMLAGRGTMHPLGYSYIGSPHEERAWFLIQLKARLEAHGAVLSVAGPGWSHWRRRSAGAHLNAGSPLWEEDYSQAIWDSRACLAFVTRQNRDELSHKAIEIAACGRPPVLEPVPVHTDLFKDGESAIFFTSVEECAEKLQYYWSRPEQLELMGVAAAARVQEAGFSEASLIELVERTLSE